MYKRFKKGKGMAVTGGEVVDNIIADLKFDDVPSECEGVPL